VLGGGVENIVVCEWGLLLYRSSWWFCWDEEVMMMMMMMCMSSMTSHGVCVTSWIEKTCMSSDYTRVSIKKKLLTHFDHASYIGNERPASGASDIHP
jgi:hypothetical protein